MGTQHLLLNFAFFASLGVAAIDHVLQKSADAMRSQEPPCESDEVVCATEHTAIPQSPASLRAEMTRKHWRAYVTIGMGAPVPHEAIRNWHRNWVAEIDYAVARQAEICAELGVFHFHNA